jgi:hypothetical protein
MERPLPRTHHHDFKYRLVRLALEDAEQFAGICRDVATLRAEWDRIGETVPERIVGDGLAALAVGRLVMVTLPTPDRPNEAFFVCGFPAAATIRDGDLFVPHDAAGPYRVLALERSVMPNGGFVPFVVEWTKSVRHNYGPPNALSQRSFFGAIVEIVAGKRARLASTPLAPGGS